MKAMALRGSSSPHERIDMRGGSPGFPFAHPGYLLALRLISFWLFDVFTNLIVSEGTTRARGTPRISD
jgi:hypothetical protein